MSQICASIRNRASVLLITILLSMSLLSSSGCGSGSGATKSVSPIPSAAVAIAISPAGIAVNPGEARTFTAVVTGTSNLGLTWAVTEGPTGGTVSGTGVYTAPATSGTFHLTATSLADSSKSATATISVMDMHGTFFGGADMSPVSGIHTASLLTSGKVLVAGGSDGWTEDFIEAGNQFAELYDPASGTFSAAGKMTDMRCFHAATVLQNGTVLLTGGFGQALDQPPVLSSAELYDPATNTFSAISGMRDTRAGHTATLLPNGMVLIAGGGTDGGWGFPIFGVANSSAELYDPASSSFTLTGSMSAPRFGHTATLLPNGKVLIAGGYSKGIVNTSTSALASTEIYDPATGLFTPGPNMTEARGGHTATLLANGVVLIAGGLTQNTVALASAELFDPVSGKFVPAGNMTIDREEHTATLLPNGRVLIVGGATSSSETLASAELYDPATGAFSITDTMTSPRSEHSATLLNNGAVLISGGNSALTGFGYSPTVNHAAELFKVLP